jgi:hypothetical protein
MTNNLLMTKEPKSPAVLHKRYAATDRTSSAGPRLRLLVASWINESPIERCWLTQNHHPSDADCFA